jgi:hypothetical protein
VSPDETEETPDEEESVDIPEELEKIEVEGVPMTIEKPKDTQLDLF